MPDLYPYPRFSLAERDRRWQAVRARMAEQGLDAIVTPQNTAHSMDFQSNTRYLTHCGGGGDADIAAVFPLEGRSRSSPLRRRHVGPTCRSGPTTFARRGGATAT